MSIFEQPWSRRLRLLCQSKNTLAQTLHRSRPLHIRLPNIPNPPHSTHRWQHESPHHRRAPQRWQPPNGSQIYPARNDNPLSSQRQPSSDQDWPSQWVEHPSSSANVDSSSPHENIPWSVTTSFNLNPNFLLWRHDFNNTKIKWWRPPGQRTGDNRPAMPPTSLFLSLLPFSCSLSRSVFFFVHICLIFFNI